VHQTVEPAILYFGTPVVLVSTVNEDGSYNLAPMSSAWWLGWRCVLGFGARSKTPQNMIRTGECVLNLPSADMVEKVNRLARLTGSDPVPEHKVRMGYRHERNKLGIAGLTPVSSQTVAAPRVFECPVQLEAVVEVTHGLAEHDPQSKGKLVAFEVHIERVHIEESILRDGESDRIDPDKWRPLIMSFQHFYGLGDRLHESTLAQIPESAYRAPALAGKAG
jgi:flavin reductase (DIM6/NTAB) family NADH-FMN oxidoreductase RutF